MKEKMKHELVDTGLDTVIAGVEEDKRRRELELAKKRKADSEKAFNEKLVKLAERAADEILKNGEDSVLAEVLVTFLDMALEMQSMMQTMDSINTAMECLGEAINFLDEAICFDQKVMEDSMSHKYTRLTIWKQKRETKKAMKNNIRRMEMVVEGIVAKYEMASTMLDMFSSMNVRLKKMMNLKLEKKKKLGKGAASSKPVDRSGSPAMKMISEVLASRSGDTKSVGTPSSSVGSGSSTSDPTDIDSVIFD